MTLFGVAVTIAAILGFLAVTQLPFIAGFAAVLLRHKLPVLPDEKCPRATLILCLRGADPFLHRCLEALFALDYPNHEIRVVVDSPSDPAWKMMTDILNKHPQAPARMEALKAPQATCSLVNASVVQVISSLPDNCEVVVILDADVVPHKNWLRELVHPLVDSEYGVAAGNRWYLPSVPTWGSLVRYLWNAGAVVQMYWNNYTWGGSLAVKRSVFQNSNLLPQWLKAFAFDTTIHDEVLRQNLKIAFVPSIMMPNREVCDLPGFFPWVQRQLLLSRLYHPGWPMVIGHGLLTTLIIVAGLAHFAISLIRGDHLSSIYLGAGLLGYLIAMAGGILLLEIAARRILKMRQDSTSWISPLAAIKLLIALPLTQLVYAAALIYAALIKNVSWRGIHYRIDGPYDVKMKEYRPYQPSAAEVDALKSL